MFGSLDGRSWVYVKISFVFFCVLILCFLLFVKRINILIFGEEESFIIGVNLEKLKKVLFFFVLFIMGIVVLVLGLISFVGLIVLYMFRFIVGSDYRRLIFVLVLSGGIFLIVCDIIVRVLFLLVEVKVGIIIFLVGVLYFLYFLKKCENEVSV